MQLAVFTPLPPAPTGIADYSELLLTALHESDDVDVVAYCPPGATSQSFPIREPGGFDGSSLAMFHVGNSEHHDFLYPYLGERPGVLVLHDLVLHHARLNTYLQSPEVRDYRADMGNREKRDKALAEIDAYRNEVAAAYQERGAEIAEIAIHMGGGRLLYAYPLYEHLVRSSRMTLVHGTAARDEVLERCPNVPAERVRRVRMGIPAPEPVDVAEARDRLGLTVPENGLLLASFGLVTPEKRIGTALRAVRRLKASGIDARYALVGGTVEHYDALAEADALGIADAVTLTGRVPEEQFWLYAFAADVCLNLRYPSAGETSATLLRLLACGRPVMVTDQIHVTDVPDSVVARVRLEGDEDGLYCDLVDLVRSEDRRRELSKNSREFILREHSVEQMVSDYREALGNI